MISKSSPETASNTSCEELYIANEKLVYQCLKRYFPHLQYDEDAQQTARMALWRACMDYDPEKGALSTLAWRYIRNEIYAELRRANCAKRPKSVLSLQAIVLPDERGRKSVELSACVPSTPDVDWCDGKSWWDSLTERQRQILRYRVAGKKIKEIADMLGYSHTLIENEINAARKAAKEYL